ncbi:MAG: hypothetical protein H0W71_03705 [Sphingomonas sp.]|nr:hypothetical protein [Sphingomonas sp.]
MVLIAAISLAAAAVPQAQVVPSVAPAQSVRATATVTVQLMESATIRFDRSIEANALVRDRILRLADGDHQAKIVEFE